MALARGEFPADKYKKKSDLSALAPFIIFIIILIIVMSMRSGGGKNQKHISDKGLPLWLLMSMMNSGRGSHSGSWGGFSGGGGGGGGGSVDSAAVALVAVVPPAHGKLLSAKGSELRVK